MSEYSHPLLEELSADPAAVLGTMGSVLEMAELTGSDFAAVLWPSDPRRPAFVYGALLPDGRFAAEDVPDVRALLTVGRAQWRRIIKRDQLSSGVAAELEVWRVRAVAAEAEVARLRFAMEHPALGGAAGADGKVSGLRPLWSGWSGSGRVSRRE
jgi:hypothetical protein